MFGEENENLVRLCKGRHCGKGVLQERNQLCDVFRLVLFELLVKEELSDGSLAHVARMDDSIRDVDEEAEDHVDEGVNDLLVFLGVVQLSKLRQNIEDVF